MKIDEVQNGSRRELCSMPWDEYRALPALNGSAIVHGRKSLLHLRHAFEHGRPDTDAMQFGRLIHCLLFESAEVEKRYRVWSGRRAGKDWKEFQAQAQLDGREVVKDEGQYSLAAACEAADGFLANARVQQLIKAGQPEQTVLAVEHGLQCKGRIDWISTECAVLTDLKTSSQIEPELFGRSFFRFGYDLKLGLYQRWLSARTDKRWPVEVIVLESTPPYDVTVIPIPDAVLDRGVEKAMLIIQRVQRALETDTWTGVGESLQLVVPYTEMLDDDLEGYEDAE